MEYVQQNRGFGTVPGVIRRFDPKFNVTCDKLHEFKSQPFEYVTTEFGSSKTTRTDTANGAAKNGN